MPWFDHPFEHEIQTGSSCTGFRHTKDIRKGIVNYFADFERQYGLHESARAVQRDHHRALNISRWYDGALFPFRGHERLPAMALVRKTHYPSHSG